jgi:hypothetical protein
LLRKLIAALSSAFSTPSLLAACPCASASKPPVQTENFVRIDKKYVTTVREIIIAFKMSPVFIALVALVGSTFQTRSAMRPRLLLSVTRSLFCNAAHRVVRA